MAKPPPVGTTPPPPPKVQPQEPPVAARTKDTPVLERQALEAALASATAYCESGAAILRCDAPVAKGAGRFGAARDIAKPLEGPKPRSGKIEGLNVIFLPAGYDVVATRPELGFKVLELHPRLRPTYGRFVAVKAADYKSTFNKIGQPVTIQATNAPQASQDTARSKGNMSPQAFREILRQSIQSHSSAAQLEKVDIDLQFDDSGKGVFTVRLVFNRDTDQAVKAELQQSVQSLLDKAKEKSLSSVAGGIAVINEQ